MRDYFSGFKDPRDRSGHFVRRSQNVKSYIVSKSVDSIRKQEPKKQMMVK